jgi:hypothetical protein
VQLTAYDVIAFDENYREIIRHPRPFIQTICDILLVGIG